MTATDDHQYYFKSSSSSVKAHPHSVGHSTLSTSIGSEVSLTEARENNIVEIGGTVRLLSLSYERIGTALTMSGTVLHGQDLPAGYVKVAINAVDENVVSWPTLKSDECLLTSGSITACTN